MTNYESILQPQESSASHAHKEVTSLLSTLAIRERFRDEYWRNRDPIADDRLLWRAQTFRHTVHLLPGQTILELGCGELRFTRALLRVSRGENPITAVTFQNSAQYPSEIDSPIEFVEASGSARAALCTTFRLHCGDGPAGPHELIGASRDRIRASHARRGDGLL